MSLVGFWGTLLAIHSFGSVHPKCETRLTPPSHHRHETIFSRVAPRPTKTRQEAFFVVESSSSHLVCVVPHLSKSIILQHSTRQTTSLCGCQEKSNANPRKILFWNSFH